MADLFDSTDATTHALPPMAARVRRRGKVATNWEVARLLLHQYGGTISMPEEPVREGFDNVYEWLAYHHPHDDHNCPVPAGELTTRERWAYVASDLPARLEQGFRRLAEKAAALSCPIPLYRVP